MLTGTAIAVGGELYAGDPTVGPKIAMEYATQHDAPEVSQSDQARIEQILNRPQNPEYMEVMKKVSSGHESDKMLQSFYSKQAEKYGLHLADAPACLEKLKKAETRDEILKVLNEQTAQYGFSVSILEEPGLKETGLDIEGLGKEKLPISKLKETAHDLVEELQLIPVEVTKASGLKSVKIVKNVRITYSGLSNPITDTIYLKFDGGSLPHELGHQIDGSMNGLRGMLHDPGFNKLNRPGFKYSDYSYPTVLFKDGSVSGYGLTDISEDKAEYYNIILGGWGPEIYKYPIVRKKTAYLLARLDKLVPGSAAYYDSISQKHE
jgi:hypothetical protein